MKRWMLLILAALLCCACALAEEPAAPTLYDASETLGYESHYLLYDEAFFEAEDEQAGQVVRLDYTTEVYDKEMKRWVNVYLPYGYDENGTERYPIIYFFHGGGCDQNTILGNPYTKNALDHMISTGVTEPFIVVAPTYYYNPRTKAQDMALFEQEMLLDIMPAVEGTYRTYAESADEAGFAASRDYRAMCGFSNGSGDAWHMAANMMAYSRYFLPCSGAMMSDEEYQTLVDTAAAHQGEFFIYLSCGGPEDVAYEHCLNMTARLREEEAFSYGVGEDDNFFFSLSENKHLDNCTRYYLYNAFLDVLFK